MITLTQGSLGFRNLNHVYFVPLIVLMVLLLERELIRSAGRPHARTATRILDVAVIPLLAIFIFVVGMRLYQVLISP